MSMELPDEVFIERIPPGATWVSYPYEAYCDKNTNLLIAPVRFIREDVVVERIKKAMGDPDIQEIKDQLRAALTTAHKLAVKYQSYNDEHK